MTVTPAGEVWPCHAAGRITTLTFENVREHPLDWIWEHSDAFTRFRGDTWMPEPCRSCPRKTQDFGGCRCQAFLVAGDAGLTDPVCSLSPHRHLIDAAVAEVERAPGPPIGPIARRRRRARSPRRDDHRRDRRPRPRQGLRRAPRPRSTRPRGPGWGVLRVARAERRG